MESLDGGAVKSFPEERRKERFSRLLDELGVEAPPQPLPPPAAPAESCDVVEAVSAVICARPVGVVSPPPTALPASWEECWKVFIVGEGVEEVYQGVRMYEKISVQC